MIETDVPVCVLICVDVFVGFQDQKLVKNKQKKPICPPQSLKSNLGALKLCWDNPNDSLRSYMIEPDLVVCVLISFDVYLGTPEDKIGHKSKK